MSALQEQIGGNHYKSMKIQVVEYCHYNQIPFMEGAVIKYVSRWRNKNGIEDLKKAKQFIELIIEMEEKDPLQIRETLKKEGIKGAKRAKRLIK